MPKAAIIPVITIDGPGGSGKGTISQLLAQKLGFHFLDSGALYRLVALAAELHKVDLSNDDALRVLAEHLDVRFVAAKNPADAPHILLEGEDVTDAIRTAAMGVQASVVGGCPGVRAALLNRQRAFLTPPGLVADGRDMGTVVFPQARLKIFLTASADERAQRRYNQLINKGESVNLPDLLVEIQERDERDSNRSVSPLRPADDAVIIDTTSRDIAQVFQAVLDEVHKRHIVTA